MKRKLDIFDLYDMGIEYHDFQRVTKRDTKEKGYRYTLSKPLTDSQREQVMRYKNVILGGSCHYKYAPEIRYETLILMDKCIKTA